MIDAHEITVGMKLIEPTAFTVISADYYDGESGEWFGEHEEFVTEITVSAISEGEREGDFWIHPKGFNPTAYVLFENYGEPHIQTA